MKRLDCLYVYENISGGEGGIRTPDTLTSMPDFESGAFNRAPPPLQLCYQLLSSSLPGVLIAIVLIFVLNQLTARLRFRSFI